MSNQLFEYFSPNRANIIVERSADGKDHYMKGIFVQADIKNQNMREYPLSEITRAVQTINEKIRDGQSILGELDHPEELSINLDRVSHMITEMWMEGKDGIGKLKLLPTPCGNIAKALLESGVRLGVSSRGSGNVSNNGSVSDFDMITVDIVAQPSAPNAYPRSIYESLYNMKGGSAVMEVARAVSQGDPRAKQYLQRDVIRFIRELKL